MGCSAQQPEDGPRLDDCYELLDRKASIQNLVVWFVLFYAASCGPFYTAYCPSAAICLVLGVFSEVVVAAIVYFVPRRKFIYALGLGLYIAAMNNAVYKDRFEYMGNYYERNWSLSATRWNRVYFPRPARPQERSGVRTPGGNLCPLVNNETSLAN